MRYLPLLFILIGCPSLETIGEVSITEENAVVEIRWVPNSIYEEYNLYVGGELEANLPLEAREYIYIILKPGIYNFKMEGIIDDKVMGKWEAALTSGKVRWEHPSQRIPNYTKEVPKGYKIKIKSLTTNEKGEDITTEFVYNPAIILKQFKKGNHSVEVRVSALFETSEPLEANPLVFDWINK